MVKSKPICTDENASEMLFTSLGDFFKLLISVIAKSLKAVLDLTNIRAAAFSGHWRKRGNMATKGKNGYRSGLLILFNAS